MNENLFFGQRVRAERHRFSHFFSRSKQRLFSHIVLKMPVLRVTKVFPALPNGSKCVTWKVQNSWKISKKRKKWFIYMKNNCIHGGEMGFCARFMKNRDILMLWKICKFQIFVVHLKFTLKIWKNNNAWKNIVKMPAYVDKKTCAISQ